MFYNISSILKRLNFHILRQQLNRKFNHVTVLNKWNYNFNKKEYDYIKNQIKKCLNLDNITYY